MTVQMGVEVAPKKDDLDALEQGLIEHAAEAGIEPRDHRPLTLFARDDYGRTIGGLVGETVWGCLQINQ